jgi:hypothetical protein
MKRLLIAIIITLALFSHVFASQVNENQVVPNTFATQQYVNDSIASATASVSLNQTITVNANGTVNSGDVVSLLNNAGVITAKTADNTMVSGIATTTATTGNPVTILLKGTANGLTGIIQGANYYRQADYSIGTTPVLINGAYIFIGYGASTTSLILD